MTGTQVTMSTTQPTLTLSELQKVRLEYCFTTQIGNYRNNAHIDITLELNE